MDLRIRKFKNDPDKLDAIQDMGLHIIDEISVVDASLLDAIKISLECFKVVRDKPMVANKYC